MEEKRIETMKVNRIEGTNQWNETETNQRGDIGISEWK